METLSVRAVVESKEPKDPKEGWADVPHHETHGGVGSDRIKSSEWAPPQAESAPLRA
jgi:hypothetical protein